MPENTETKNRILQKMLDRLFAALINGPSLNCRPHASRQRIDLVQLSHLKDQSPETILRELLGEAHQAKVAAKVPPVKLPGRSSNMRSAPKHAAEEKPEAAVEEKVLSPEELAARKAFSDQQTVFNKLRAIAEDSRTFENDTGVHVLQLGFPLLSMPAGGGGGFGLTRTILAPLAFISLDLSTSTGASPSIQLASHNHGADLVVPNIALLSWLERQTGQTIGELPTDEEAAQPWAEISAITKRVCDILRVELPACFAGEQIPEDFSLLPAPRADDEQQKAGTARVIASAVLGLYPLANQGLLRDTQAMVAGEPTQGPIESFIKLASTLEPPTDKQPEGEVDTAKPPEKHLRDFAEERLVTTADPCQARAVRLARSSPALVVHGPPGTGKSQTITNIIGDHLSRGQRVLFVCDKRTALDVVLNRLNGMGLGGLCAIVHDPQRDQRELYKSIREQLEGLTELKTSAAAEGKLQKMDAELQRLHGKLTDYNAALMQRPDKDSLSFHELMGRWLSQDTDGVQFDSALLESVPHSAVEQHAQALTVVLERSARIGYASHPWTNAVGLALADYLATPVALIRSQIDAVNSAAHSLDATIDPAAPPLPESADLAPIAAARANAAEAIHNIRTLAPAADRTRWASVEPAKLARARQQLDSVSTLAGSIEQSPLDGELLAIVRNGLPVLPQIAQQIAALDAYTASAKSFLGFLAFGKKSAAAKVLAPYGLQPSAENSARVSTFLTGLKSRLILRDTLLSIDEHFDDAQLPADDLLLPAYRRHAAVVNFVSTTRQDAHLADILPVLLTALSQETEPADLLRALRATSARVEAIKRLMLALGTRLFSETIRRQLFSTACAGKPLAPATTSLSQRQDSLEDVLRVQQDLQKLPPELRAAAASLIDQSVTAQQGLAVLRKASDAAEINRRIKNHPTLMALDNQQLQSDFVRYQQLDAEKKPVARQELLHLWASRQKERLLAATGSRLNSAGADLRRRLTIRGERAMRLRQVVHVGQAIEGGDPLFDLRPIWLVSPETVAQVFPRQAIFDVVIFDEASQCRLEEALPVLLRARRVVIAGDPRQLPPTRFFETAISASEEEEIESDQQMFESQQGEIEDLLGAALNTEIEESYLDVHYRSRNADLIAFSNGQFYGSRLQPIPGHPANRSRFAPISLYKVSGIYEQRCNHAEAEQVCQIVHDLLKRAEPPSIGIACFNITQRDLIVERLDAMAAANTDFARQLALARERHNDSAFEGLFVKNLENVQGDERDDIIISTTYGTDAKGKFYRRFGPVGTVGGGRRLNVLVTRARNEVHLVTSIPEAEYRNLPPVPAGQTPGGAWLLFAYLAFAEKLALAYEADHQLHDQAHSDPIPTSRNLPTRYPSDFAVQLSRRLLAQNNIGSDIHWGNDGFCVDLALHHPQRDEDITLGVLCDLNRFASAADPVEWEIFRSTILESQGWKFSRIWTPHFFRDPQTVTQNLLAAWSGAVDSGDEKTGGGVRGY